MHQNQWLAAICELEAKEGVVVPSTFPLKLEQTEFSYKVMNFSRGEESSTGRWASGPSMDSQGTFEYVQYPQPHAPKPVLKPAPPYIHDTPPNVC